MFYRYIKYILGFINIVNFDKVYILYSHVISLSFIYTVWKFRLTASKQGNRPNISNMNDNNYLGR